MSEAEARKVPVCYFVKDNILMRKWRPKVAPSADTWRVVYQIIVPPVFRCEVLSLAYDTPLAGHLGVNKTYRKILNHFY